MRFKEKYLTLKDEVIRGKKADYNKRWFFEFGGKIYQRLSFEEAYKRGFQYPCIDIVAKNG
ncbi:hypothetical protein [Helicobacter cappadocius]|uniref:Uncharacterized protein n=1 Tax=Helicobacter cappadocius TaxID=3063998 RepID=A0AA90PSV1_9HELI|nr:MULTISPECIES: hypothetical protein [unclassified Helicobacter]MDO7252786.1 hypothetical protein [Helicobacter sp. faydin-H75]MDP2538829.1 hypothetical protein [Helicobacter sp. faydin-H76]